MDKLYDQLLREYLSIRYPMGTGSDEWQDIKTDFEIENDGFGGVVMNEGVVGSDFKQQADKLIPDFSKFKNRVNDYIPKDKLEKEEKDKLLRRITLGLTVLKEILSSM
jgi:hypothetical protein